MSKSWAKVKLGEVVNKAERLEPPAAGTTYRQIGVRLWGEGAYERASIDGSETKYKQLNRVLEGDLIVNKIWARNGSVAVVQGALAGSFASSEFPVFAMRPAVMDARWMHWLTKSPEFWAQCDEKARGTSGKNRIRPEQFLAVEIPLPPLDEQKRIVAYLDALSTKITQARTLRHQSTQQAEALLASSTSELFSSLQPCVDVGSVCEVIDPNPSHRYPVYVEQGVPIVSSSEFTDSDGIDARMAKQVPESFYEATLGRFGVGEGDVVFSRKGRVGYARLHPANVKLAMTHTLCVLKPERKKVDSRYLLHFSRSLRFLKELTGTMNPNVGVPTLGLGVIRAAVIPIPPLADQRRIVAELDALQAKVDALKQLQADTEAELTALQSAALDRAFKGEL